MQSVINAPTSTSSKGRKETPSEILQEIYDKLRKTAKSSETPLKSIVLSLLVLAVKQLFKGSIFSCPVQNYQVYASVFIYGPVVLLFCLSILVSKSWWKTRNRIYLAILPPIVWLLLVFADADFYVCAELGPIEVAKAAANGSSALEAVNIKFSNTRSHSQIIAWALLLSLVGIAAIVLTVHRCFTKLGSKIIRKEDFEEMEAEYAMKLFNERIKPIAEAQAKTSVDQLFDAHKDEKPEDLVKLAEDYLMAIYPKNSGAGSPFSVQNKSKEIMELLEKRSNAIVKNQYESL